MNEILSILRDYEVFRGIYTIDEDGIPVFKAFLDSEWRLGRGRLVDDKTPIDNSLIARVTTITVDEARDALRKLYEEGRWKARNTPGEKRLEILEESANLIKEYEDVFINILVYDAGKTFSAARGEVHASIDRIKKAMFDLRKITGDYIPGDWDKHTLETEGFVRREPYGVVAIITPFNYPLYDNVMKIVSAFIAGNAIILKPSMQDPLSSILLTRILIKAGFPESALLLALMRGDEVGQLLPDRRIGAILFTGSTETGKKILATAGVKSYLLELGGGDPAIILRDADLDQAASDVVKGIISYSGQRCDAIKIVIVEEDVYEIFKH